MNQIQEILNHLKNVALSDDDLLKLMDGKANVVVYRNLSQYSTVNDLLYPYGVCFILYEWKPHYGHWCCLIRHNNLLEAFDPYGLYPDDYLKLIPEPFRSESNQVVPALTNLLLEGDYELSYNEFQFQKRSSRVKDCGRWCVVRALLKEMDLEQFRDLFLNKNGDDLVTFLTS